MQRSILAVLMVIWTGSIAVPQCASAQDLNVFQNYAPAFQASWAVDQMANTHRTPQTRENPSRTGAAGTPNRAGAPQIGESALTFRPSLEARRHNVREAVARISARDQRQGAEWAEFTASTDIIEYIGTSMGESGLRTNNASDAFALWWITAWRAYNKDYSPVPPATLLAVRRQSASYLLGAQSFRTKSDLAKQAFAEGLFIDSIVLHTWFNAAKTNPAIANELRARVMQTSQRIGVDFSTDRLTENGFETIGPRN